MKAILLVLCNLILLGGCISFKSDYVRVDYYRLEQETTSLRNIGSVDCILLVQGFEPVGDFGSDMLFTVWDDGKLQKYYYHKWVSDCPELVTDFIVGRFNLMNAFEGGVSKGSSLLTPDYILEGQILDMSAHSSRQNTATRSYIEITLKLTLIKNMQGNLNKLLLSRLYTEKITRLNNSVESIAPAFSKGFSEIADKVMNDLQEIIVTDKNANHKQ